MAARRGAAILNAQTLSKNFIWNRAKAFVPRDNAMLFPSGEIAICWTTTQTRTSLHANRTVTAIKNADNAAAARSAQ